MTTKPKNKKPSVSNSESKTPAPELKPKVKREITTSLTPTTPTSSSVVDLSRDEDDVPDDIATSAKRVYGHVLQTVYRLMGESLMPFSDFIAGPEFDKQVRRAVDLVLTDKAASVRKQFAEHWKKQVSHQLTIVISYCSVAPTYSCYIDAPRSGRNWLRRQQKQSMHCSARLNTRTTLSKSEITQDMQPEQEARCYGKPQYHSWARKQHQRTGRHIR